MQEPMTATAPKIERPAAVMPTPTQDITLRDYVRVLFRRKGVILAIVIGASVAASLGLQLKTPVYEAQVKMLISAQKQIESPFYRDLVGSRSTEIALTQTEVVKSNPVLERAVKALRLYQRPLDYEQPYASPLKAKLVEWMAKRAVAELQQRPVEQQQMIREPS
jgi:uncharacterized protein involved in exopolysaccharide biosynthesis